MSKVKKLATWEIIARTECWKREIGVCRAWAEVIQQWRRPPFFGAGRQEDKDEGWTQIQVSSERWEGSRE